MRVKCVKPQFSINLTSGGSSGIEPVYLHTYKRVFKQSFDFKSKFRAKIIEKILINLEKNV
jgi:hypothetical protein